MFLGCDSLIVDLCIRFSPTLHSLHMGRSTPWPKLPHHLPLQALQPTFPVLMELSLYSQLVSTNDKGEATCVDWPRKNSFPVLHRLRLSSDTVLLKDITLCKLLAAIPSVTHFYYVPRYNHNVLDTLLAILHHPHAIEELFIQLPCILKAETYRTPMALDTRQQSEIRQLARIENQLVIVDTERHVMFDFSDWVFRVAGGEGCWAKTVHSDSKLPAS